MTCGLFGKQQTTLNKISLNAGSDIRKMENDMHIKHACSNFNFNNILYNIKLSVKKLNDTATQYYYDIKIDNHIIDLYFKDKENKLKSSFYIEIKIYNVENDFYISCLFKTDEYYDYVISSNYDCTLERIKLEDIEDKDLKYFIGSRFSVEIFYNLIDFIKLLLNPKYISFIHKMYDQQTIKNVSYKFYNICYNFNYKGKMDSTDISYCESHDIPFSIEPPDNYLRTDIFKHFNILPEKYFIHTDFADKKILEKYMDNEEKKNKLNTFYDYIYDNYK